ncbi:hypothetical protein F383_31663 [Gossypium arboreum]|uniref:Uncharacterized protein n=1 Tax=Gossypium arboreum TaxID=29729 RepID=A0A0B0MU28_GOSAR|nr:hypothetical protein F383_31663 [Gossypium arboreum]
MLLMGKLNGRLAFAGMQALLMARNGGW